MILPFLDATNMVRKESRGKSEDRATTLCDKDFYQVGEFFADYSELTVEELSANDADADDLISRSRIVSEKRGL